MSIALVLGGETLSLFYSILRTSLSPLPILQACVIITQKGKVTQNIRQNNKYVKYEKVKATYNTHQRRVVINIKDRPE